MHFEVFWQVTLGIFLTNLYPFWRILRYFHTLLPENFRNFFLSISVHFEVFSQVTQGKFLWKMDIHFGAFWGIFTHYSWKNFEKMYSHFGAFWGIFTSDSRKIFEKIISILAHFEIFSHINTGNFFCKNWYPFWYILMLLTEPLDSAFYSIKVNELFAKRQQQ